MGVSPMVGSMGGMVFQLDAPGGKHAWGGGRRILNFMSEYLRGMMTDVW